jgi:UPF0176 protein
MTIRNIAGYRFLPLTELDALRLKLLDCCEALQLKGTILLSEEGININLAGSIAAIEKFKTFLKTDERFASISFHQGESETLPFRYLKVKIKKEIITMRSPTVQPEMQRAPHITPQEFKQWLDEGRDITILDTRNDYEIAFGHFKNAVNPQTKDFGEFAQASQNLNNEKPIVMYCTGGIRCEKAALHLLQAGFQNVYQLQGGILIYFKEVGNTHYEGECFVFDERVAVNEKLQATGTKQCKQCQKPIKPNETHECN